MKFTNMQKTTKIIISTISRIIIISLITAPKNAESSTKCVVVNQTTELKTALSFPVTSFPAGHLVYWEAKNRMLTTSVTPIDPPSFDRTTEKDLNHRLSAHGSANAIYKLTKRFYNRRGKYQLYELVITGRAYSKDDPAYERAKQRFTGEKIDKIWDVVDDYKNFVLLDEFEPWAGDYTATPADLTTEFLRPTFNVELPEYGLPLYRFFVTYTAPHSLNIIEQSPKETTWSSYTLIDYITKYECIKTENSQIVDYTMELNFGPITAGSHEKITKVFNWSASGNVGLPSGSVILVRASVNNNRKIELGGEITVTDEHGSEVTPMKTWSKISGKQGYLSFTLDPEKSLPGKYEKNIIIDVVVP